MLSLPTALSRALGQLADPPMLRVLAKSIVVTLVLMVVLFVAIAEASEGAVAWLFEGAEPGAVSNLAATLGAALGFVAIWLLFRLVALAVIQFFADDIVAAVEAKYYPAARAAARKLSWREEFSSSLRSTLRAIVCNGLALIGAVPLLLTGIGPAVLFFLVNAWLLGHELQDLAWARHRHARSDPAPIGRIDRFLLGATVAGLLVIPLANLLAPVIGAAAACHLVHRKRGAAMPAVTDVP